MITEGGLWGYPLFKFTIDMLPPRSGIDGETVLLAEPGKGKTRFRALKLRRFRKNQYGPWSGWFLVDIPMTEGIVLQWNVLAPEEWRWTDES